jgi:hypothetical protein
MEIKNSGFICGEDVPTTDLDVNVHIEKHRRKNKMIVERKTTEDNYNDHKTISTRDKVIKTEIIEQFTESFNEIITIDDNEPQAEGEVFIFDKSVTIENTKEEELQLSDVIIQNINNFCTCVNKSFLIRKSRSDQISYKNSTDYQSIQIINSSTQTIDVVDNSNKGVTSNLIQSLSKMLDDIESNVIE